jgi:replicative DNA helicase Mcm
MATETEALDPQELFLQLFKEEKYCQKLRNLSLYGKRSIFVEFRDIVKENQELAKQLLEKPEEYLGHARAGAYEQLLIEDRNFADTISKEDITIRVTKLFTAEQIRSLGAEQLKKLVMVEGIVVRSTPVQPMITIAAFKCKSCGGTVKESQKMPFIVNPDFCTFPDCKGTDGFVFDQEKSEYTDCQYLRIQERPEDLPPRQLPRALSIKLVGKEMVETARPGDHVAIVGIPQPIPQPSTGMGKSAIFKLEVVANSAEVLGKEQEITLTTKEEEEKIIELSKDPVIHRKIVSSIIPSIHGMEHVKEAIMYLLFGGCSKNFVDITVRGEMNVLIVGDPGVAKTQILQYIPRISPRGLYTSGQGTTAAGLTAAVINDKQAGISLEAGALVLGDKGVVCIDEMDKMRQEDRVAIHEAMEQHTVSVAKGGIVATLNARTSILAACNPSLGRYEPNRTIAENINLPTTLLSRFDLIFIYRDIPNKENDEKRAEHILELHQRKAPPIEPPINPELLRKYIAYAKKVNPNLSNEALKELKEFFLAMRSASETEGSAIAITARQLEALVRISEARARAALRSIVTKEDAQAAIDAMKHSLEEVGIDIVSKKIDIDLLMTGTPKSTRDEINHVYDALIEMNKEAGPVKYEDFVARLDVKEKLPKSKSERYITQLLRENKIYSPREGYLLKV